MPNIALIYEGFLAGSTLVKVYAEEADETEIVLCNEEDFSVLGTGEISNNEAAISLGTALLEGQRIIAFVGEAGTAGSREVLASGYISTGWKKPVTITVGETEYTVEEYEAETGNQVALLYDPLCINRVSEMALRDEIPSQTPISFLVRIDRDITQTVVSVEDVLGVVEFLIQFDDDTEGNDNTKIYTADGTYQVKVIDAADATRQTTRVYTIDVTTAPPEDSEISNASYVQSAGVYPIIEIIADSDLALECKVDGISNWLDMDLIGGKRWRYSNLPMPTTGLYIARVRVKTDTADAVAMNATIY